jgi:hypothetical protein
MKKGSPPLWTKKESRFLQSLKSPDRIQKFLDEIPYHLADTAWSPRLVMENREAHCLEGAIFAAAALREHGHPAWILDLEAENDSDHVIAVYKSQGLWGSIASSNYTGCRGRKPVYKTLRELALSYFEDYFNLRKEHTLRTFSKPVDLKRFDKQSWQTTEKPVWFIAEYLLEIPHTKRLSNPVAKRLPRVTDQIFRAGILTKRSRA